MSDKCYSLINKYALLLSTLYLISFASKWALEMYDFSNTPLSTKALISGTVPMLFDLLLNIIAAFLVHQDINRYTVKTKYVFLATVIYRPLGIVVFLLFFILQEKTIRPTSQ